MNTLRVETWRPSAELAKATLSALNDLARHWRHAMALAFESTEAGQAYFADYAFAMQDADIRAIPMAARQWVAHNQMPPKPSALGQLAREVTAKHFPKPSPEPVPPPPIETGRNVPRLTALHQRAAAVLGSQTRVLQVWDALLTAAPNARAAEAIRAGDVDDATFDRAVESIRRGAAA